MRTAALLAALVLGVVGCGDRPRGETRSPAPAASAARTVPSPPSESAAPMSPSVPIPDPAAAPRREVATLGAGCFWCVEAVLEQVEGVLDVRSGFMGGTSKDPTYEDVCSGETGHAEVVQVTFDPSRVTYETLLDWFWRLHDPTTLHRQGADVGTQYRSAIFWHTEAQRDAATASRAAAQASFAAPIVTEITRAGAFYPADEHHQDYYRANRTAGYCRVVIAPKLEKLRLRK